MLNAKAGFVRHKGMSHHRKSLYIMLIPALLAGCWDNSEIKPPVARINLKPVERYDITVGLTNVPGDIDLITGVARFGVHTRACLPYKEKIARVTIGTSHMSSFRLIRGGDDTYTGYMFLDWPVDEDYYGLGVCSWQLASVDIAFTRRSGVKQVVDLSFQQVKDESPIRWYCRIDLRDKFDNGCLAPSDPKLIQTIEPDSFLVDISSKRHEL